MQSKGFTRVFSNTNAQKHQFFGPQPSLGFPGGAEVKASTCSVGDLGSIPGSGRSPGEGNGYPLQYSDLENSRDYTVPGVAKSWMQLSLLLYLPWWLMVKHLPAMWETWVRSLGREDTLEKEMATHSSILAWEILWRKESGGLQSMASQRVGHNLVTTPPPPS